MSRVVVEKRRQASSICVAATTNSSRVASWRKLSQSFCWVVWGKAFSTHFPTMKSPKGWEKACPPILIMSSTKVSSCWRWRFSNWSKICSQWLLSWNASLKALCIESHVAKWLRANSLNHLWAKLSRVEGKRTRYASSLLRPHPRCVPNSYLVGMPH